MIDYTFALIYENASKSMDSIARGLFWATYAIVLKTFLIVALFLTSSFSSKPKITIRHFGSPDKTARILGLNLCTILSGLLWLLANTAWLICPTVSSIFFASS